MAKAHLPADPTVCGGSRAISSHLSTGTPRAIAALAKLPLPLPVEILDGLFRGIRPGSSNFQKEWVYSAAGKHDNQDAQTPGSRLPFLALGQNKLTICSSVRRGGWR